MISRSWKISVPTGEAPVRGGQLAPDRQHAQHDHRARERHDEPEDEASFDAFSGDREDRERGCGRGADLQRAADRHGAPDEAQPGEGELEADREEQQDHAELGDLHDAVGVADEVQAVRAGDTAGDQEPDGRGQSEPVQPEGGGHGEHADDGQFADECMLVHDGDLPVPRRVARAQATPFGHVVPLAVQFAVWCGRMTSVHLSPGSEAVEQDGV